MCPSCQCNSSSAPADRSEMVGVENQRVGRPAQAVNGVNGVNGHANPRQNGVAQRPAHRTNPYAPRASDFLNNVANFKIIESTLRGEDSFSSLGRLHMTHISSQRVNSSPMHSLTPRPRLPSQRPSMPSASSISNSHHPLHQNSLD